MSRTIKAIVSYSAVQESGGLLNGKLPIIPDSIHQLPGVWLEISHRELPNMYAYEVTYEEQS